MKEKNFEPLKKFITNRGFDYELTELHASNINVTEKDGFFIYNYGDNVLAERNDPIIVMCRGLVLDSSGKVFNFPFKRFFNYHERECDKVDFRDCVVQEKLDGSLLCVWHNGNEWEITTRGSFYPNEDSFNFKEQFLKLFNNFDKLYSSACYMFEMMSRGNRIITRYDEEFVVLLAARDVYTLNEYSQQELDDIAQLLGVRRPKMFESSNIDGCRELFCNMRNDEEGLVVVDSNFNRFKLKQESYLKIAKIVALKNQDILDYVLGKTTIDADFEGMDELKEKVEEVKKIYYDVKSYCEKIYNNIKHIEDKKEFASHALNYKISNILFKMYNGRQIGDIDIRYNKLFEMWKSIIDPSRKELIILRGIPGSGKSTWVSENNAEIYSLSRDKIRIMFKSPCPFISQEYNPEVYNIFFKMFLERMKNGSFTIIDSINTTNKSIKQFRSIAERFGFDVREINFNISLEEGLARNSSREEYKRVPEEIIIDSYVKYSQLIKREE